MNRPGRKQTRPFVEFKGDKYSFYESRLNPCWMAGRRLGTRLILSRAMWEEEYGSIPPGMQIVFTDGNPRNCVLENLRLRQNPKNLWKSPVIHDRVAHLIRITADTLCYRYNTGSCFRDDLVQVMMVKAHQMRGAADARSVNRIMSKCSNLAQNTLRKLCFVNRFNRGQRRLEMRARSLESMMDSPDGKMPARNAMRAMRAMRYNTDSGLVVDLKKELNL